MGGMTFDLVPIWIGIIGLSVFLYVLLDGFDLGVGVLHGFARERDKPMVMNAIAPIWDGNETWLILGGVALLAVFPLAFAIIIPAVYFPCSSCCSRWSFEGSRSSSGSSSPWLHRFWSAGFRWGSTVATFAQGAVLGSVHPGLQGGRPRVRRNVLGLADALLDPDRPRPHVAGYGLLGAGWLIIKCDGRASRLVAASWVDAVLPACIALDRGL